MADLLYEVINRRYEKKSVIVTHEQAVQAMERGFFQRRLLDRLLHHAEVTVIEGSSYPVRESEQESTGSPQEKAMNQPAGANSYLSAVITLYLELPQTPMRASPPPIKGEITPGD